jgi:hypothetical protein
MFRITQDPSSGSIDSCLIKATRSGLTVFVSFVASRNAKHGLVTNDTNNKLYTDPSTQVRTGCHSTDPPVQITTAVQSTDPPMQIKPHCSVHGSSSANRDTLFSPRIFGCKSRHAVQSTDPSMQIKPHCSVHGSSNENRDTLFIPRTLKCVIFSSFPALISFYSKHTGIKGTVTDVNAF